MWSKHTPEEDSYRANRGASSNSRQQSLPDAGKLEEVRPVVLLDRLRSVDDRNMPSGHGCRSMLLLLLLLDFS